MLDIISAAAKKLQADGFSKADRIAVYSENRIEYYLLTLACWKIGAIVIPVSTRYPDQKLALALENVRCKDVFISQSLKDLPSYRCHILEDYLCCQEHETAPMVFEQFKFDLAAEASILFTSGSSGSPKGVVHTIGNHYYNALGAAQNIPFARGDRWLMSLPMYHISGFSLIMRSLISGGTVVFPETGESISDAVINKRITHLSLVPAQLNQLMKNPQAVKALRRCKSILLGGTSSSTALIKQAMEQSLPLSTTYGLTESASQVTTITSQALREKPNASGKPLPYRELKIADDGEISLKGQTLFKGYVLKDKVELPLDGQGYFHTGDMGILDDDGFLIVTGRKDRMFISGGENIHPEEIEKAMLDINSVEQAYVVSVPDAAMGQRSVAFIKTTNQSPALNTETITLELENRIERFKIPVAFLQWPDADSGNLKPDAKLFRRIALEKIDAQNNL